MFCLHSVSMLLLHYICICKQCSIFVAVNQHFHSSCIKCLSYMFVGQMSLFVFCGLFMIFFFNYEKVLHQSVCPWSRQHGSITIYHFLLCWQQESRTQSAKALQMPGFHTSEVESCLSWGRDPEYLLPWRQIFYLWNFQTPPFINVLPSVVGRKGTCLFFKVSIIFFFVGEIKNLLVMCLSKPLWKGQSLCLCGDVLP